MRFLIALALAACVSNELPPADSGHVEPGPAPELSACETRALILCDHAMGCADPILWVGDRYTSCVEANIGDCANWGKWDDARLDRCESDLERVGCDAFSGIPGTWAECY